MSTQTTADKRRSDQKNGEVHKNPRGGNLDSKFDDVCFFLTIFVGIYALLTICKISDVERVMLEHSITTNYWEYLWVLPGMAYSFGLYLICSRYLVLFLEPYMTKDSNHDEENHQQRLRRTGNYIMGFIYYFSSIAVTWYVAKNEGYLPKMYGGDVNALGFNDIWPVKSSNLLRIVYLMNLGHHFERLLFHSVVQRGSKTFYTMMLHHVITVFLIWLSFLIDYFIYGIPVFLFHDMSDLFLAASRILRETHFKKATEVVFAIMMVSWVYTRIVGFIWEVIYPMTINFSSPSVFVRSFWFIHAFLFMALYLLAILNIFWFVQICNIAFARFIHGKTKYSYEDGQKKKNH